VGQLVVIAGTGTNIGKTHFSVALLNALASRGARVAGLKPVESGFTDAATSDAEKLRAASTFHVKQWGYRFAEPISPHLAARRDGVVIDVPAIVRHVASLRRDADVLLVELAGGLFTPLSDALVNADLAAALEPDTFLVLAPDRLGVLHDLLAAQRASLGIPLRIDGVVLIAPKVSDTSTGLNLMELQRILPSPARDLLASIPRGPPEALAEHPDVCRIAERVRAPLTRDGRAPA
jgi:dethiobiotin synthetase